VEREGNRGESDFFFRVQIGTVKLEQVLATTNGDWICDWCQFHGLYCLWLPEGVHQKTCDPCAAWKSTCTIQGERVSKRKWWEWSGAECSWLQKKSWAEVESDVELEGSRTGGWKAQGLQDISFTLLGLKDSMEDWTELLREHNGFLKRIALSLDGGLVTSDEEVPEEASTK